MTRRLPLRTYLLALVLVALVPFVLLLILLTVGQIQRTRVEAERQTILLAGGVSANVSTFIEDTRALLGLLAQRPLMQNPNPNACDPLISQTQNIAPLFIAVNLVDLNGDLVCSSQDPRPGGRVLNYAQADWFRQIVAEPRFTVSAPRLGGVSGVWLVVFAHPVLDANGELAAIVAAPFDLTAFRDPITPFVQDGLDMLVTIVDVQGTVVARSRDQETWIGRDVSDLPLIQTLLSSEIGNVQGYGLDGTERIYGYATLNQPSRWIIFAGIPTQVAFAAVQQTVALYLLTTIGALVLATGMTAVIAQRIERPIHALSEATKAVGEGKAHVRADGTGPREVAQVAADFNRMIDARGEQEAALRASEARFRSAVENFPYVFVIFDTDLRIQFINEQGARAGGFPREYYIGKTDESLFPPEVTSSYMPYLRRARNTGEPQVFDSRFELPHTTFYSIINYIPLLNPDGSVREILGLTYDITQLKQAEAEIRSVNAELEARVAERTKALHAYSVQLEATNRELEAFSYSVSHDLRAPLRAMEGFSVAVLEDYGDQLDDTGRDYLQRIRAASVRMAALIDDLLRLSRITRREMERKPTDLSRIAASIMESLQELDRDRQVSIMIEEAQCSECDPGLMQIVLENLLGNAWKFTAKTPNACIEFGSTVQNGETVYFVRDNGVGFDMTYADKLFTPFQRLHANSEFSGTGIGLATVQRVIHRHGGRLWAESVLHQGTTIYFTLS